MVGPAAGHYFQIGSRFTRSISGQPVPTVFCGSALVLNRPQRLKPAQEIGRLVSAVGPLLERNSKTATDIGTLRPATGQSNSSYCVVNTGTGPSPRYQTQPPHLQPVLIDSDQNATVWMSAAATRKHGCHAKDSIADLNDARHIRLVAVIGTVSSSLGSGCATPGSMPYPPPSAKVHPADGVSSSLVLCHTFGFELRLVHKAPLAEWSLFFCAMPSAAARVGVATGSVDVAGSIVA